MGPPPPPGFGPPPPPGFGPPPPFAPPPPNDSFSAASTNTSSTSSGATASTKTDASKEDSDALFGTGAYDRIKTALGLLASNPAFGHAGKALSYVMKNVASKDETDLSNVDKGAIQQAILQMKSLVHAHLVSPAQAGKLNDAISNLQGALS